MRVDIPYYQMKKVPHIQALSYVINVFEWTFFSDGKRIDYEINIYPNKQSQTFFHSLFCPATNERTMQFHYWILDQPYYYTDWLHVLEKNYHEN